MWRRQTSATRAAGVDDRLPTAFRRHRAADTYSDPLTFLVDESALVIGTKAQIPDMKPPHHE